MLNQSITLIDPRIVRLAKPVAVGASLAALLSMGGCVFGPRVKSIQTETLYTDAQVSVLYVQNDVGDITIIADPSATVLRAEITKIGKGRTQAQADEALSELEITFGPRAGEEGVIEASVWHPKQRNGKQYAVDWIITTPANVSLELFNDVGEIEVEGIGYGASITNDVGEITAYNISGGLTIYNDVGDIHASATGPIDLKVDVGDVRLRVLDAGSETILVRTDIGDVTVNLPVGWEGHIDTDTDIGGSSVRGHTSSLHVYYDRRGRFEGDLGEGTSTLKIRTDIGDARVRIEDNDEVASRSSGGSTSH